jgi:hypothetical protein
LTDRACVGGGWHAEGLVPGETGFREPHRDGVGRVVLEDDDERRGPGWHRSAAAAPVVDLAWGQAGQAGEAGLTDPSAGEQGGEFGVQKRPHTALREPLFMIK